MSARNLTRYFMQEAGITPYEFVQQARVDAARMMLEASDRLPESRRLQLRLRDRRPDAHRLQRTFRRDAGAVPRQFSPAYRLQAERLRHAGAVGGVRLRTVFNVAPLHFLAGVSHRTRGVLE